MCSSRINLRINLILSGTIISPGSTQLRAKDIESRLLASKATCIIADTESAEFVDEVQ